MKKVLLILLLQIVMGGMTYGQFRPFDYQPQEPTRPEPTEPSQEQEADQSDRQPEEKPFVNPFEEVELSFNAEQIRRWQQVELEEKACRVSPVIEYFPDDELNHHQITVDFSGSGKVEVSVAHSKNNNLKSVLKSKILRRPFVKATSGRQVSLTSHYKGESCAWILLRSEGEVLVKGIRYQALRSRGTLYGHSSRKFNFGGVDLPYRIMAPFKLDPEKKYPLVVTIGGSGSIGSDNIKNMEMVGLGRFLYQQYLKKEEFACYSLVPQIIPAQDRPAPYWPKGAMGEPSINHPDTPLVNEKGWYTQACVALIRSMLQDSAYRIDPDRVYLTGFSYGGKGTWEFLRAALDLFAAAVSGGGWAIGRLNADVTPELREALRREVQIYKHVPVYITAGELDIPMAKGSRLLHEVLRAEGGECTYLEFKQTKHISSATRTWGDRRIIQWLFSQQKSHN